MLISLQFSLILLLSSYILFEIFGNLDHDQGIWLKMSDLNDKYMNEIKVLPFT